MEMPESSRCIKGYQPDGPRLNGGRWLVRYIVPLYKHGAVCRYICQGFSNNEDYPRIAHWRVLSLECRSLEYIDPNFTEMEDTSLAKRIGQVVRHLRTEAGLSQEQFAGLCDLHRTYIGAIERGEKMITVGTANKVAKALGLSLSQFFQQLD